MKRFANSTTLVWDDPVILRSVTTLFLAALLILQSVVPCCAMSNLLTSGDESSTASLQVSHSCSCCPHSPMGSEHYPSDNEHSPDGKCPFCGGLLFHAVSDDATAQVSESPLIFASLGDAPECTGQQAPTLQAIQKRQVLGQPFLNTGMRLLI